MFKTKRGIAKEVEQIKEVLMPSQEKTLILHMWTPDHCRREVEAEHTRVVIVPTNRECMPKEEAKKE